MVSKTATIFLLAHASASLLATLILQWCNDITTIDIPPVVLIQCTIIIQLIFNIPTFLTLQGLNYCCRLIPKSSRVSFKRHLVTAFLLGPLLAQLVGRWMGWLESNGYGSVSAKASACWEQIGLRDLDVIQKSVWCQEEYGMMGREEAKRVIGGRRGRGMYIEDLAGACIQLDLEFGGVCRVVGEVDEEWDVDRVENEGRNSERAHMRWIFEECHARFGVEMQMIWKKGKEMPELKFKTAATGQIVELDTDTMQFNI